MSSFEESLEEGKRGETAIAKWLMGKGFNILPVYEVDQGHFKGPVLYSSDGGTLICPDLLCMDSRKIIWIEAKHKNAFSWYRKKSIWTTGIDLKHYNDYIQIALCVSFPVWLFFLHKGGVAKDSPPSPSGLFCNDIQTLRQTEDHRSMKWGPHGMVYWSKDSLIQIADYKDGNIISLDNRH